MFLPTSRVTFEWSEEEFCCASEKEMLKADSRRQGPSSGDKDLRIGSICKRPHSTAVERRLFGKHFLYFQGMKISSHRRTAHSIPKSWHQSLDSALSNMAVVVLESAKTWNQEDGMPPSHPYSKTRIVVITLATLILIPTAVSYTHLTLPTNREV